jgi:hypothetical protein
MLETDRSKSTTATRDSERATCNFHQSCPSAVSFWSNPMASCQEGGIYWTPPIRSLHSLEFRATN